MQELQKEYAKERHDADFKRMLRTVEELLKAFLEE